MAEQRNLYGLLSELKDITRPNMFLVSISNTPTTAPSPLFAIKIDIPSVGLGEIALKRMGKKIVLPGATIDWPDVTATFYDDVDGLHRDFFLNWQQQAFVQPGATNNSIFQGNTELDYLSGVLKIQLLNSRKQDIGSTTLYKVWPKIIGQIQLDYGTEDGLNTFDVIFTYSYAQHDSKVV